MRHLGLRILGLLAALAIVPACKESDTSVTVISGTVGQEPVLFILPGGSGRTVLARGGTGSAGSGGNGADIDMRNVTGSDACVQLDGSVDTSFSIPPYSLELGSNPRTIQVDTVYTVGVAGLTSYADGDLTLLGDDGVTTATGLFVAAGATLTLNANLDAIGADGLYDSINLSFGQGVLIEGAVIAGRQDQTVTGDAASLDAANLRFRGSGGVVIEANGSVDVTGSAGGGNGGGVQLHAGGLIINRGVVVSSGGTGATGGDGGTCTVTSDIWAIFNTGFLTTTGGVGTAGLGGNGGTISLLNSNNVGSFTGGGCFVSGDLTSHGGDGTAGGGDGGAIVRADSDSDGPVVSSGTLDASGGNATALGDGGNGGAVNVQSFGGELRVAGAVLTRGGLGAGAASTGGNGGNVTLFGHTMANQPVMGGTFIGANVDSSGGNGDTGGDAGFVVFIANTNVGGNFDRPRLSPCYLVGYALWDSSGGDGTVDGGDAGYCRARNEGALDQGGSRAFGSIRNEVPFVARGGHGATGAGGNGDYTVVEIINSTVGTTGPAYDRTCVNVADLDSRGGDGATTGGNGGFNFMFDRFDMHNEGVIRTSGGAGGTGMAGNAGYIRIWSDGRTTNMAALEARGGVSTGAGDGGHAGPVFVEGQFAVQLGDITSDGGDSVGGTGGNGSNVEIGSFGGTALSSVSGLFDVSAGTGGAGDGFEGIVTLDGIRVDTTGGLIGF